MTNKLNYMLKMMSIYDNDVDVGKYARNEVDVNFDKSVGWDVHKIVDFEVGRGNDVRKWCW